MRAKIARESGMTLLEVLVALLLLSALSVGILSALRSGHRTYSTILRSGRGISDVALTQRLLRRIIESAHPLNAVAARNAVHFGIEGTRETLLLTAPMSQASGARGLYRYEISLTPRADGASDLVLRYGLDRDGQRVGSNQSMEFDTKKEVLLERVREVSYDYLAKPEPEATGPVSLPQWIDSWHEATLPMLVRLRVEFDPTDSRRWPELVVAPRLTDGAQCVFDAISGVCREGS